MSFKSFLGSFINIFIFIGLSTGCGAKKGSSKSSQRSGIKESIEGKYQAKLITLNSSVSGLASGIANIKLTADQMDVKIEMKNVPTQMEHGQKIYAATECPRNIHDTNDDGFIDPLEASKVLGGVLIPLDGDLNSQDAGEEIIPESNGLGHYVYFQEGFLPELMDDLNAIDLNLQDDVIKLLPKEHFSLVGKVIVILGVSQDVYLPGSIQRLGNKSEYATMPIACGQIERVIGEESSTFEDHSI
jgi:hypothetical protein